MIFRYQMRAASEDPERVDRAAEGSRRERELVFPHAREWAGRFYDEKKVKVVYIEEEHEIVVVTVLAYYGRWS